MRGINALKGKLKNIDKADLKDRARRWLRKAKPVILTGCIVMAVLLVLGGTLAWFTAADEVLNIAKRNEKAKEFIVVEVDVFDPEPEDGLYTKQVGAQNVGDIPAFVRLLVLPVFKSADGSLLPAVLGYLDDSTGAPVPPDANVIVTDFNLANWDGSEWTGGDWADGGDGYFYYLNRLDPGISTDAQGKNLFNHLELAQPMPEGYENASLVIEVKCEALTVTDYRNGWWGLTTNAPPENPPFSDIIVRIDGRLLSQWGA